MSSIFSRPAESDSLKGTLIIDIPYLAAQIQVYDHLSKPVKNLSDMRLTNEGAEGLQAEISLAPGVYKVESILDGIKDQQYAIIRPTETIHIQNDKWKLEKPTSAAPLKETSTTREWHRDPAQEWSRKITWATPQGNSRFFLFVRTLEPEKYPHFYEGLSLFTDKYKLVTDFSEGIQLNKQHGWMAFNANLPAGYYILKRGRRGYRTCYQPVYLCAGWESQLFISAQNKPSLRTMSLNMARLGVGFQPDDKAAIAADVIMSSLKGGGDQNGLVTIDKIYTALDGKFDNPWLGIIAAYLLRLQEDNVFLKKKNSDAWNKVTNLIPTILQNLYEVNDHPDMWALQLKMNEPANKPFLTPPLIYQGLRRVQQHACTYVGTIPINSLTDKVLKNVVTNSAWTAWRNPSTKKNRRSGNTVDILSEKNWEPTDWPFLEFSTIPGKLPIINLQYINENPASTNLMNEASLIQLTSQITNNLQFTNLPGSVEFSPKQSVANLLDQVDAYEISDAYGLSLAQTESSLYTLRQRNEGQYTPSKQFSYSDQAILVFALQKFIAKNKFIQEYRGRGMPNATAADEPMAIDDILQEPLSTITIEECVIKLQTEADRLISAQNSKVDKHEIYKLANRLYAVAAKLLISADFVAITDSQGQLMLGNGAFSSLTNREAYAEDVKKPNLDRLMMNIADNSQSFSWEHSIKAGSFDWTLKRTKVEDNSQNEIVAFVNILKNKEALPLTQNILQQVKDEFSELSLLSSFIAYGSSEPIQETIADLTQLTARLESYIR